MNRPASYARPAVLFLTLLAVTGFLGDCRGVPPRNPEPDAVSWTTYTDDNAGYSVELPDVFRLQGHRGESVIFRYDNYPVLCINLVDEEEGKDGGLWVGRTPVGRARLGGRDGYRYVYNHYDGPSYMRTVSTVVPHRGKYLGLEFRTDLVEPDSLQRRILGSFRFR